MQLTTSSEPKSSRPTAKKQNKKTHSSQGFMSAWLQVQLTRTAKQWSAVFATRSGHAPTIKLTKNKFILGLTVNFLKKIGQHQQDINLIKKSSNHQDAVPAKQHQADVEKSLEKLGWDFSVQQHYTPSLEWPLCLQCTIFPTANLCSHSCAQSFQLQICALIHVKVLTQTWGALTHTNFPLFF